jgi:hypothetical protein
VAVLRAHLQGDASLEANAGPREVDLWDAWRFAAVGSALALKEWMSAELDQKELGYNAYVACLDGEEQAATALAAYVEPAAAKRLRARR